MKDYNEMVRFIDDYSGFFDGEIPETLEEVEDVAGMYFTAENFVSMFGECHFDDDDFNGLIETAIDIWLRNYSS